MRKIEETFAEHIANMHIDFEDKAKELQVSKLQYEKLHPLLDCVFDYVSY